MKFLARGKDLHDPSRFIFSRKLFYLMRITSLMIFALLFSAGIMMAGEGKAQNLEETIVVVGLKNQSLKAAINQIKQQTNIRFAFVESQIAAVDNLNLPKQRRSVSETLKLILENSNLKYEVRGNNTIVILEDRIPNKSIVAADADGQLAPSHAADPIKGQVFTADGQPIVGATVTVKNKNISSATDELGVFSINAEVGDVLVFTMVGMAAQEVIVENRKPIKVLLKAKEDKLNDVVVVGYGKQKKLNVTGAVASVNMQDMKTPVASLSNALAGKVAGVISVQSSGEPGYDNSTFTIRGIGTFTGNTSPLVIVDGVQRDDVNSTYGGAYNNIDPQDIASISLLKDASSTAMYGAKGANGVLIITTKRGIAGKARISIKAEGGITGFTKTPKMLDGVSYMKLYNEARSNMDSAYVPSLYTDEIIKKTASGLDPYVYPNVNWINEIYKKNAGMANANLNVMGGGETVRYFLSASFYNQDGPYKVANLNDYNPNLNFKRYDFRSNIDVNVTKTTLLQMNLAAMLVNARYPGISSGRLWYLAYATTPVGYPTRYPDGKWAGPTNNGGANPLNEVQNNGYSTEFRPSVQSVFTVIQKMDAITKGLEAYGRFSFDSYGEFDNRRSGLNDLWYAPGRDGNGNLLYTQTRVGQQFLDYSQSSSGERVMYLEGNIKYNRRFAKHDVGGMVLYNMRNRLVSTAGSVIGSIPYRNQALAGRLNYGYDDKYLLEVNAGYTGSENFEKGKKFGFFPAVSAGWVISKENFFSSLKETVNILKIRGSYGVVGNDNIGQGDRFPYLTKVETSGGTAFGLNGAWANGISETQIGVQDLTWERSYKADVGLEVGLLNRLNIIVDYYQDRRKDILIARQSISNIAGYSGAAIYANLGEMNNHGVDASVEYNSRIGNAEVRVFGNVTYSRNKVVFSDEPSRKYDYQRSTGKKYGEFTGYISEGLYVDEKEVDSRAEQKFGVVQPGDIKYKDLNGDDVVDAYDWKYLDKSWFPDWLYGAGFSVNYKNFDFAMFFQGVENVGIMANGSWISGNSGEAGGVGVVPFSGIGQYPNNTLAIVEDRWTKENPRQDAYYPRLSVASLSSNNYQSSSRWLKDGSYIRMKQVSIGYTVNSSRLKNAGIGTLHFYLSGQNLLTFSKFKLWDPELGSNGAKYPITRIITFGVNAQL